MNRSVVLSSIFGLAWASLGAAQAPASLAAEITQSYTAVKNNIMKTATKMPEDSYSFKPTPELRSFAEVLDHVADSQMRTCAGVAGDQKKADAAGKVTKADVAAALNDAFAECDKAYGSLNDANAAEMITTPRGQRSKLGLLSDNTGHDREQYGILSMYLRLKGVVPPSSEKPATR